MIGHGTLPDRQSGVVAVMFAILIVALCTLYAANLAWDTTLDARRSASIYWREQAVQVALGAEDWVAEILRNDQTESETDHLGEIWAMELPPLPVDGAGLVGEVVGSIEDVQGRFNVNSLVDAAGRVDPVALEQFGRLLSALEIDPRLAGIAADWLDADSEPSFPDGAEDTTYTGFQPPYRAANQPLTSVSELAAIDGMDADAYRRLRPHITAYPGVARVNVNTATPAVLQSLDERIEADDVERLLEERAESGFADVQATFDGLVDPERLLALGETSDFFRLTATVRIGTVRVTMYSLLHRGAQGEVSAVLRTFGAE